MVSSEMIYEKLVRIEREIEMLKQREVILGLEEFSLSKVAKILHLSPAKVIEEIKAGRLKARQVWVRGGYSYRITARAIYEYQNNNQVEPIPPTEKEFNPEKLKRELKKYLKKRGL